MIEHRGLEIRGKRAVQSLNPGFDCYTVGREFLDEYGRTRCLTFVGSTMYPTQAAGWLHSEYAILRGSSLDEKQDPYGSYIKEHARKREGLATRLEHEDGGIRQCSGDEVEQGRAV